DWLWPQSSPDVAPPADGDRSAVSAYPHALVDLPPHDRARDPPPGPIGRRHGGYGGAVRGQGRRVVPSSLRAELIVELQIQDSIVAGRTPLELSYLLAAGMAGWAILQLPYPLVVRVGFAALFAVAGAALAFVRVAGQDLTSWCAALVRYALASRLAVYGPSRSEE